MVYLCELAFFEEAVNHGKAQDNIFSTFDYLIIMKLAYCLFSVFMKGSARRHGFMLKGKFLGVHEEEFLVSE